jgi:hypothetical protein
MDIHCIIQAGVTPITSVVFSSELQRDWAREETIPELAKVVYDHLAMWEQVFAKRCNLWLRIHTRFLKDKLPSSLLNIG